MESAIFASPAMYIALVIMEIAGIPAVTALGGIIFFGGLLVGSVLVGAAAAMIRVRVGREKNRFAETVITTDSVIVGLRRVKPR